MGQKTNPISLRLQTTNRYFDSSWYNRLFYSDLLSQDFKIQYYLNSILKQIRYPLGRFSIQNSHKKIQIVAFFCSPHKLRRLKSNYFRLKYYRNTGSNKKVSLLQKRMMSEKIAISAFRNKKDSPLENNNGSNKSINTFFSIQKLYGKSEKYYKKGVLFQNFLKYLLYQNFLQQYYASKGIYSSPKEKAYFLNSFHLVNSNTNFQKKEDLYQSIPLIEKKITPFIAIKPFSLANNFNPLNLNAYCTYQSKQSEATREVPLFSFFSKKQKDPISSILFFRKIYLSTFFLTSFFLHKKQQKKTNHRRYLLEQFFRIYRSYQKFLPIQLKKKCNTKAFNENGKKQPTSSMVQSKRKFSSPLSKENKKTDTIFEKKNYNYSHGKKTSFARTNEYKNSFLQKFFTYSNSMEDTASPFFLVDSSAFISLINWQKDYLFYKQKKQIPSHRFAIHCLSKRNGNRITSKDFLLCDQPAYLIFQRAGSIMRYHDYIEATLSKTLSSHVYTQFLKIKDPFRSAVFLADEIVYLLQRRIAFRFIKNWILRDIEPLIQKKAILGIRITCSGRVGGRSKKAQRAKSETIKYGQTSLHVFSSHIDFASKSAFTSFGVVGIKVWICYGKWDKKQLVL